MSTPDQPDMFGDVPQQNELFEAPQPVEERKPIWTERWGWLEPLPVGGHTPETIRAKMHRILAEARAAEERMPWTPRVLRTHTATFPYMAEWLKNGEGEQLLLDFKAELDRLEAPVVEMAPNWRDIWGLAA